MTLALLFSQLPQPLVNSQLLKETSPLPDSSFVRSLPPLRIPFLSPFSEFPPKPAERMPAILTVPRSSPIVLHLSRTGFNEYDAIYLEMRPFAYNWHLQLQLGQKLSLFRLPM